MNWFTNEVSIRNQLHGRLKHQVKFGILEFFDVRSWCWQQWGPGIESMHWLNYYEYTGVKMPWAWDCMKYRGSAVDSGTLYILDDAMLTQLVDMLKKQA